MFLKQLLSALGVLLYHAGLARRIIRLNGGTPKVLVYHACENAESDFIRGLNSNTTPAHFARHLDFLREHYQLISVAALENGRVPERALVITFDDGYRSVYRHAYPLLAERGIPATVYLVTRSVGNEQLVWVNAMNWLLHRYADECVPVAHSLLGVPATLREPRAILDYVQANYSPDATERALAAMYRAAGVNANEHARVAELYVTWKEVELMASDGMTFGSHTANHPNLRCLSAEAQRVELQQALQTLERPGCSRSLAYPFGEFNNASRQEAVALGHTSVMQVGGVNRPLDLHAVARVPVGDLTSAQLFAEIEIVTPAVTWLKRRLRKI